MNILDWLLSRKPDGDKQKNIYRSRSDIGRVEASKKTLLNMVEKEVEDNRKFLKSMKAEMPNYSSGRGSEVDFPDGRIEYEDGKARFRMLPIFNSEKKS